MKGGWIARSLLASTFGLRLASGCSSDAAPATPDDAGSDVSISDAEAERRGNYEPPDPPRPEGLPEGWDLERSYDKLCSFYVPRSRDVLPSPVRWEPCPSIVRPAGAKCQIMANDSGVELGRPSGDAAWVAPDGNVVLSVIRTAQPMSTGVHRLIADADGPVHTAMFIAANSRCTPAFARLLNQRYAIRIYEDNSSYGGGLLASDVDDLTPRIAIHLNKQHSHSVRAGPFFILDVTKDYALERYSWDDGSPLPVLWSSSDDQGLQQTAFTFAGDAMFWGADDTNYSKVHVHTPAGGVRDFLSAGLVIDRGFGAIGTDGKDLVWIEAKGRKSGGPTPFDSYDIMTAPYTTDPSKVVARRLRSERGEGYTLFNHVVGCGHAARWTPAGIRILRLSDGWSWLLPLVTPDTPPEERGWAWADPLALTCTELFLPVAINGGSSRPLVRLRLDSLGPGVPPD